MSSRIEQLIDEIEEYIDNCKYQPLSNSKIIVNKDEIDDLLRCARKGAGADQRGDRAYDRADQ